MSFPKAPLKRFNEHVGCAPAPGSYDVKAADGLKGPVSFEKSQRFRAKKESSSDSQNVERDEEPSSPARLRKQSFVSSTPNLRQKPERDMEFIHEMKKQKALEKQIRVLLKERAEQDKKLQLLEEDFKRTELKLVTAVREKTSLAASIASLERQMADLNKANDLLKTKFSDDGLKRKINSLCAELMDAKNKADAKDKEINGLQANFEGQIRMLQASLAASKADMQSLTERHKLLDEERQETAEQNDTLEKELCQAQVLIEELKSENKSLEEYLSNAHEEMQDLRLQMRAQEQEYEGNLQITAAQVSEQSLALARLEDLEHKLLQAQAMLEEALQKVTQLEAQLAETKEERSQLVQEKAETEKKLAATLEQMSEAVLQVENLKLLVDQAEERLRKKELEEMGQRDKFSQKEEELLAKMRELAEKYIGLLQEKENLLIESDTREKSLSAELEALKQKISEGDGQCQNLQQREEELKALLEKEMETSSALKRELQKVQEEMMQERGLLEEELEGALDELDRLQQQEQAADRMILQLEQVNRKRAEELTGLEETLKRRNQELEKAKEKYRKEMSRLKEEHSSTLCKLSDYESKASECNEAIALEANKWRTLFEELQNKVRPFQQQLDAFEAEKNALLNEHGAAQDELGKLSEAYGKLLGHQNQKQKIKHVMKLKMENTQLKQEVARLRAQLSKDKLSEKHLQSQLNDLQGVRRFDPSKAFQHDAKENIYPKAPLKDGNRNKC
ncbi:hyaluronan mediated motility receptor isoform X3 [Eleutherodactylus coqui]|uniref:hyaluronan mediated motility receptor isoform X3 n=1 Tax=Eleutherodactylus coqui TaxID=57060 RepID=UPI0034630765